MSTGLIVHELHDRVRGNHAENAFYLPFERPVVRCPSVLLA